jgi:hypothetical protein
VFNATFNNTSVILYYTWVRTRSIVFNATFNNTSVILYYMCMGYKMYIFRFYVRDVINMQFGGGKNYLTTSLINQNLTGEHLRVTTPKSNI